jgi:hypothetical protein
MSEMWIHLSQSATVYWLEEIRYTFKSRSQSYDSQFQVVETSEGYYSSLWDKAPRSHPAWRLASVLPVLFPHNKRNAQLERDHFVGG